MHPQNTACVFLDYIHFVISAVFCLPPLDSCYVVGADRSLLAIGMRIHIAAPFGELIFKARIQTLV